jgi:NADH-quinone oxidoreductase subunit G
MPKCTIDGRETEVATGTTVMNAALGLGIHIPHFCWHPDLPVDGNCRMCMVEIDGAPKLMIACNTQVNEGMVIQTHSEKAAEAHRTTLEFLLVNHPIDCPVCDQAGECYLQDQYMGHGLHDSRVQLEDKVAKRKVVDLGPIMLDAERCVLCSRCIRFEQHVTGTNSFGFVDRGNKTQIATFEDRPIEHGYSGNLADVCPVGALLSRDFRFKTRVWFLESAESVCPGCSTGCNVSVDHRDGEVQRLRPRRNAAVNQSWMCDEGRALYKALGTDRLVSASIRDDSGRRGLSTDAVLDAVAERLRGARVAMLATPQATNEDLFAFRLLADRLGALLDFRIGNPQDKLREREDAVLLRADRNPNTQGCLDLGMGRSGVDAILDACRRSEVDVLLLQGTEWLASVANVEAPFVVVMASHDDLVLESAHVVLPTSVWAEGDGTFTNYQRRVQRIRAAVPAPHGSLPRWELAGALLRRLGVSFEAATAREVFSLLARAVPDYGALSHRTLDPEGHPLPLEIGALG